MVRAKIKSEILNKSIARSEQNVVFKYIVQHGAFKVLYTIVSNPYADQCSAIAKVWRTASLDWSVVASITKGVMKTKPGLTYHPREEGLQVRHFEADFQELQRLTALVLL